MNEMQEAISQFPAELALGGPEGQRYAVLTEAVGALMQATAHLEVPNMEIQA